MVSFGVLLASGLLIIHQGAMDDLVVVSMKPREIRELGFRVSEVWACRGFLEFYKGLGGSLPGFLQRFVGSEDLLSSFVKATGLQAHPQPCRQLKNPNF